MLQEVWGSKKRTTSRVAVELGMPRSTLRRWIDGESVPSPEQVHSFRALVARLQDTPGSLRYSDAEWEAALAAAGEEATSARNGQNRRRHRTAPDLSTVEVRERASERAEMNAFAQDPSTDAPSYFLWHADGPVGKTTLLADYVCQKTPDGVDILTFFVSAAHGTDTRAAFVKEIVGQVDVFLGGAKNPIPEGIKEWNALLAKAAAKSAKRGRNLLLVVDGLDDDVAWSGDAAGPNLADECGAPKPAARPGSKSEGLARTVRRSTQGSIAALLPSRPPSNMRVIASLRRCAPLPRDVAVKKRHPLHQSQHLRNLLPVAGVPQLRQPPLDATALGEPVAGLLAVADGGLRTRDLAELTGHSADHLDRLVHGPAGRALVTEDSVLGTHALADSRLVREVREGLGDSEVRRLAEKLLVWSRKWCAAGWPDDTPPYPLTHQLRLLTGMVEHVAYVFDLARLRRLADKAGPDVALAQLDDFETEIAEAADVMSDAETLTTLVSLCSVRSLLRRTHDVDVPDGAAALFVRLGDLKRARGLARSAPTAFDRAVHLADVAVEVAYAEQAAAGRTDTVADTIVHEVVEWLVKDRVNQGYPGTFRDPESYARILHAASTLVPLVGPGVVRPVFRVVLQDPAAGTAATTEAAKTLDAVMDLHLRAETLSAGDLRARTAAVELYGELAQVAPYLSPYAGDRVEAVCEELDDTEGLAAVDVRATAAFVLVNLPAKRHHRAAEELRKAQARMDQAIELLRNADSPSDALSEDDRAHLRRELAGTLKCLAKATVAMEVRGDLDRVRGLMEELPEERRVGVLGDPLLERAQLILDAAEADRARQKRKEQDEAAEERRAKRRAADATRKETKEKLEKYKADKANRVQAGRRPQPTQTEPEDTPLRRPTPSHRPRPHRRSTGLPLPGDSPHSDFSDQPLLPLLLEADDELSKGHLLRSREILETALRNRPASRPGHTPFLSDSWTADLCQAMGAAGASAEAEALVQNLPDASARALHLAALSLGCSLTGKEDLGTRYARAAARLVRDGVVSDAAYAVAQALAHTGDESAATTMAMGGASRERDRQALTAVAAGLVRHCPEAAARVAEPLVEVLVRRMTMGGPRVPLLELAALLLAFPDVRNPAPWLSGALGRAALSVSAPTAQAQTRTMVVLALLERLGCLPDEAAESAASAVGRWRHALGMGPQPPAELALLAALDSDAAAVWRYAEAARTPADRVSALGTAAAYLAGVPVVLVTDSGADDRVPRTFLALARGSGDGGPPDEEAARYIMRELLCSDAWTRTIPLLPALAPGALGHLGAMARGASRPGEGAADAGASF
ncbi:hypothetical protein ACFV97_03680 [Streptomyces sp. NPDC059913]|uniref:hypothetical protein n=1 Tax=unclassified Streptomyces TaxID=2593676 RepID=UPI003648B5D0